MTIDSSVTAGLDENPPEACPTCGHLASVHDVIGRRWCAVSATTNSGRNCICSRDTQTSRVLSRR